MHQITPSVVKQPAQHLSLPSKAATAATLDPVVASSEGATSGHISRPPAMLAAPALPDHALQIAAHNRPGRLGRTSLGLPQQEPQEQITEAVHGNRDSLGGTQGAVTGLTHLALRKHEEAMQLAAAATRLSAGLTHSEDTQALGLQVLPCSCIQSGPFCSSSTGENTVGSLLQPAHARQHVSASIKRNNRYSVGILKSLPARQLCSGAASPRG